MSDAQIQQIPVLVTLSGSLSALQWQATPDPVECKKKSLIVYTLQNNTGSSLSFCQVDIEPNSSDFSVQSLTATRIELLDEDKRSGRYAVYLWVQDGSGNRYRSPDPQVINKE